MSNKEDLALMAHLMRRAGFGANRDELEQLVAKGYDAVVEDLVNPPAEKHGGQSELLLRYYPGCLLPGGNPVMGQANWLYNMVSTDKPWKKRWLFSGTTFSPPETPSWITATRCWSRLICSARRAWVTIGT